MHVIHVFGFCFVGLMTVLAIASSFLPWAVATATLIAGGVSGTADVTLWDLKLSITALGGQSGSWSSILDNDLPYCISFDSTSTGEEVKYVPNSEILTGVRAMEVCSVLCIVFSGCYFILAVAHAAGKVSRSGCLLIPAFFTFASAVATLALYYDRFYDPQACKHNLCERFVRDVMATGLVETASCGPGPGLYLVFVAGALGLIGLFMLCCKTPEAILERQRRAALEAQGDGATAIMVVNQAPVPLVAYQQQPQQQLYQPQQQQQQQQQQLYQPPPQEPDATARQMQALQQQIEELKQQRASADEPEGPPRPSATDTEA
jgi:hypothetical protein